MTGIKYEPWEHLLSLGDEVTLSIEPTPGDKPAWWCPESDHILMRPGMTQIERRSHLAHELAHRDLGHCGEPGDADRRSAFRREREADELAARRLVTLGGLITALTWSERSDEVAEALGVTLHLLNVRLETMYGGERATVASALRENGVDEFR